MERARATWTDERLDDLAKRMDDGFARLDQDIRALRPDLNGRIDELGISLRGGIDSEGRRTAGRFDAVEARIDGLQRLMIQISAGTLLAILATLVSVLVTRG